MYRSRVSLSVGLALACVAVLVPVPVDAWPGGPPQRLIHGMQLVGVESAPDQVHHNDCLRTMTRTPRRMLVWHTKQTQRWAIGYALGIGPPSPYSLQSSRFFCDDVVEFLPDQMNFEQCEQWHTIVQSLAPKPQHSVRHVFKEADGRRYAIFCTAPTDCIMMQVAMENDEVREMYSHPLDYPWD